jgi:hypothetical protein
MKMNRMQRFLTSTIVVLGAFALASMAVAAPKQSHHNGQALLGAKIKTNGNQVIDKKGKFTVSAEVKDGKVAGIHVRHATKGNVPVTKYKTNKKMVAMDGPLYASLGLPQDLGITYIGYSYIDDYGYEQIYWFPYDMVIDPVTGAVDYIPMS